MRDFNENLMIERLKRLFDHKKVKITELSTALGIPYRTLQNQLSGSSKMSALNLLLILEYLELPSSLLTRESDTIDIEMLANTLEQVFEDHLPRAEDADDGTIRLSTGNPRSRKERLADANILAYHISREYGVLSYYVSGDPWNRSLVRYPWDKEVKKVPQ